MPDVPIDQKDFIGLNEEPAKAGKPFAEKRPPPADADEWAKVRDQIDLLER